MANRTHKTKISDTVELSTDWMVKELQDIFLEAVGEDLPYKVFRLIDGGHPIVFWRDNRDALNHIHLMEYSAATDQNPDQPLVMRFYINHYTVNDPFYSYLKEEVWRARPLFTRTEVSILEEQLVNFTRWIAGLFYFIDSEEDDRDKAALIPPHQCLFAEPGYPVSRYIWSQKAWDVLNPKADGAMPRWARSLELGHIDCIDQTCLG
ncbi:MAG: hypothetical protein GY854_34610 [Deltaproteobacteria bacterium]|nr:hypothetical protein [Deltaproteobacteria bacterium]